MAVEQNAARESAVKPKPLTRRVVETQAVYHRRLEVEAQIVDVLNSGNGEIFGRLAAVDGDERFLKSETLVYLLREFSLAGEDESFNQIYEVVNKRILRLLAKHKIKFQAAANFEDLMQDVQMILLRKILDFDSNAGDFAQVSFGKFIVSLADSEMKKYFGKLKQANDFVWLDEDAADDKPKFEIAARELSAETRLILRQAIERLPAEIREAAFLHYLEGWQIDSQNPNEPTLSRRYDKSEKTIRNWLRKAAELLQDWKGEL